MDNFVLTEVHTVFNNKKKFEMQVSWNNVNKNKSIIPSESFGMFYTITFT